MDDLFERVVQKARPLVGCGACFVLARHDSRWVCLYESGIPWGQLAAKEGERLHEVCEAALREQNVQILTVNCLHPAHFDDAPSQVPLLAVPFGDGPKSRGVLLMIHKAGGRNFELGDVALAEMLALQAAICRENAYHREVQINYFTHTVELLVTSMEGSMVPRDHLRNVARYAGMMARRLHLADEQRRSVHFAALLHDVGMVKIRPEMHRLPEHFKLHPVLGAELVGRVVLWNDLVPIIRHHHENIDGSGYPDGLQGEDIPLEARIVSIAESYDAMTNPNSYRSLLTTDMAMDELRRYSTCRYDAELVTLFEDEVRVFDESG